MAPKLSAIQLSKKEYEWVRLEIIAKGQKGDDAWVEFKAYHRLHDTEEMDCLHERSVFKRIQGKWLYVGGEVE